MDTVAILLAIFGGSIFGYVYHWKERRLFVHLLPYGFLAVSTIILVTGNGKDALPTAAIFFFLYVILHFAVLMELRKR